MPMTIDEQAHYSEADVAAELGIGRDTQRQARRRGELRFMQPAGSASVVYSGRALLDWLNASTRDTTPPLAARRRR